MRLDKRKKISFSVAISLISLVASFVSSFLFTKFLLSQPQIGDVNFGLKTTVDSFVSFVSIFTFGMSSTFIRFHKKYANEEKTVISCFNIVTSIIAISALVFGVVLVVLTLNNVILNPADGKYTQQQVYDFLLILIVSISYIALSIVLGNSKWFLESKKSIVFVRIINFLVIILYPLISIPVVLSGGNMVAVTIVYSSVYLLGFLSYLIYRVFILKNHDLFLYKNVKKEMLKEIIVFSFFVIVSVGMETLNHSADKLILTIFLGAAELTTIYQLSMTLNQVLLSLCSTIYAPYLPYLTEDIVNNKTDEVQKTYDKVSKILLLLSFLLLVGFAACGKDFVYLWVGEGKEIVYYFTCIIFAAWPLYSMVMFSTLIHRASNKHVVSSLMHVASFLLHIIFTLSFVSLLGIWACIIGTAISMVSLGIGFLIYNKKVIGLKQRQFLITFFKLFFASILTIGICLLFNFLIDSYVHIESRVICFVLKGAFSVIIFTFLLSIFFLKKVKHYFGLAFHDEYSFSVTGKASVFSRFRFRIISKKNKINKLFSIIFIAYFLINFSSYYLGGIPFVSSVINTTIYAYLSKFISYCLIISYISIFVIANERRVKITQLLPYLILISISLLSCFAVPKTISFIAINDYNFNVYTTFSVGIADLATGFLNLLIDLFVMFAYVFIFRGIVTKQNIYLFLRFIVIFTLCECIYSLIFQFNDYAYFFAKATGTGSFPGYETNLSATFSSKNGFGFLLFQCTIACYFLLINEKKKRYIPALIVSQLVTFFTICKTALISVLLIDIILLIFYLASIFKKKRKQFVIWIASIAAVACVIGLLFTPLFRKIEIIDMIDKKIIELFFLSGDATIKSREMIWSYAFRMIKGPFIVLGYGKTVSPYFLNVSSNFITHTFHNGLLDILCSYGIFGVFLYFNSIVKVFKFAKPKKKAILLQYGIVIAVIFGTLAYGLMENVFLFMSSTSIVLTSNLVLSVNTDDENEEKYLCTSGIKETYYELYI